MKVYGNTLDSLINSSVNLKLLQTKKLKKIDLVTNNLLRAVDDEISYL